MFNPVALDLWVQQAIQVVQEETEEDGWTAAISNNKHQQADNDIKAEGASSLSEALKTNTSLQTLNLECEQEGEDGWISDIANNQHKPSSQLDWWWRSKGTERVTEDKHGPQITEYEKWAKSEEDGRIADIANNKQQQIDNYIGAEGARALSVALKTNTVLTTLNLGSVIEMSEWVNCRHCQETNINTQTTNGLKQKGQERWAMHWRQTEHSIHWIWEVGKKKSE